MENTYLIESTLSDIKKALYEHNAKRYSEAIRILTQAHDLLKSSSNQTQDIRHLIHHIVSLKGLVNTDLGNYEDALKDLNSMIEHNRFDMNTLFKRAKLLLKMKRYEECLEDCKKVKSLQPSLDVKALLNNLEQEIDGTQQSEQKYFLKKKIGEEKVEDEEEEEILMGFSNLKRIDRKSLSQCERKKQAVYFGEQQIYQIEVLEAQQQPVERFDTEKLKQKLLEQEKDFLNVIQPENDKVFVWCSQKTSLNGKSKKSILKKTSFNTLNSTPIKGENQQRNTSFLSALSVKDIQGKIINKEKTGPKFRKSEFYNTHSVNKVVRKSILKQGREQSKSINLSFDKRNSSFVGLKNIEGKLTRSAKSYFSENREAENIESCKSFDSSNEFNIYDEKADQQHIQKVVNTLMGVHHAESTNQQTLYRKVSNYSKKSVLKPKDSFLFKSKEEHRRTVLFKQTQ